ncbi:pyrroloquinoline quinone biosynthesis peptide chaperone PqqD [Streptomyces sp. IB201691-2A2]|uniref:pyrroloquinoline quinone biosynthesis peptide chaperone PqqD n=2 Tax=unclassified Streptomyces TaxID=2593676 RepID=UPI00117F7F41|nr:pyrroloquinoline quinone biosynthesis peptide chaperone PqqD [Streptomyces sp. IB201691-2A2]
MKPVREAPPGARAPAESEDEGDGAGGHAGAGAGENELVGVGEVTVAGAEGWSPVLSRSVMLRHDRVRGTDLLLMPERVVVLRGSAGAVLRLCDGRREVAAIVAELAERFPGASVATEVPEFLGRMREEGWIR